ncbi:AAA family ATPase [Pontibacter sp. Tf4]|uniref:ATP-dependent nuclease n=1 Tax=Pontibacter sp. Tf4 TaxID=2761620 RepID=UPI0016251F56|nr:AAA family ATPase [Pontibacter sp. Tf4]MBB6611790.1 AAA family ATPase [Pontibacter sp. Tf4]
MAKSTKSTEKAESNEAIILTMPKPRLVKLIVKNFRCIGSKGVEIDLDEIVVLVGPNNAGKSSLLKAYEVVMSEGSKNGELTIYDFPNNRVDPDNLPQIELHTIVFDERVGTQWLEKTAEAEWLVKEKWTWESTGKPVRRGWNVTLGDWDSKSFPFGPANIANQRRPEPHKVNAFDNPDDQANAIKKLLMAAITERVKNLQAASSEDKNEYHQLLDKVKDLQKQIVDEAQEQIDTANTELSGLIAKVFPGYQINFDAKPENDIEKTLNLFKADPDLLMGPSSGHLSTIDKQGSGARRTLLWTALKYISESNQKMQSDGSPVRPHLLLLDEPEICLHPNAIREACNVLYELPTSGNWQVMVTTHSPIFIDFSRDNTTIVRVNKDEDGEIQGTTVFRPSKAKLDDDDKKNLKLLNLCDPYVAEFFFGGKVIIVEGDTEYTAFNYIKASKPEEYRDVHIIRARGKATIVSLIKILNHFGTSYSVLHDSDTPLTKKGDKANPAWGNNPNILAAIQAKPSGTKARLLASLPNLEEAYFGEAISTEKPYNALKTISEDPEKFAIIECLLQALINHEAPVPNKCTEWETIEELKQKLEEVLSSTNDSLLNHLN